jgi:surface carbohydrate biosynthesis protein
MELKILLVINKPNRELSIMDSIKKEIILFSPKTSVEIIERYRTGFVSFVFSYRPDVILTFPFTGIGLSEMFYLFKVLLGSKIICFRTEGVIDVESEYNLKLATGADTYGKNLVDLEIFWGNKVRLAVASELVKQRKLSSIDRALVVGYPRIEKYFDVASNKRVLPERIKFKFSAYDKSNIVLFVTGFHLANYSRNDLINAGDLHTDTMIDLLVKSVEVLKEYRSEWIENIIHTAEKYPDLLFVVKKHPIEKKEDYCKFQEIKNILHVYEDIQVNDIIEFVGLFVHYGSTSLIDAYLSNTPSLYVYSKKNNEWFSELSWFSDLGCPSSAKVSVSNITQAIKNYIEGKIIFKVTPEIKKIMKDYFNIEYGYRYEPSKELAKILLSNNSVQKINIFDKYLYKSLISIIPRALYNYLVGLLKLRIGINYD